jgi:hypothetical protein
MFNAESTALNSVLKNILPTAARTTTANGTGVDLAAVKGGATIILDSAAGTGTTPTLDVKLQSSPDNSTWTDIPGAVFAQVVAVASQQILGIDVVKCQRYIRTVSTITGTTPSFTYSLNLAAVAK